MSYATEHIASTLKAAREARGLSQRELSKKAGVPQGHISKIENAAVDLRLSSLVVLARALDLELTLVPRKTVSAVQSIVRTSARSTLQNDETARQAHKELKRLQDAIASATKTYPAVEELAQLRRQIGELAHFRLAMPDLEALRATNRAVQAFKNSTRNLNAIRESVDRLKNLRNALAHTSLNAPQAESRLPAYSLDEDDHG